MQRYLNLLMKNGHINLLGNIDGRVINEYWVIPNTSVAPEEYTVESLKPLLKELTVLDFTLPTMRNILEVYKAIEDNSVELIVESVTDLVDSLDSTDPRISAIRTKFAEIVDAIELQGDVDVNTVKNEFISSLYTGKDVQKEYQALKEEVNAALYEVECLLSEKNRDNDYINDKLNFINDQLDPFSYMVNKIHGLVEEYNELQEKQDKIYVLKSIELTVEKLDAYVKHIHSVYNSLIADCKKLK